VRLEPYLDPRRVLVLSNTDPSVRDRAGLLRLLAQTFSDASDTPLGVSAEQIRAGFEDRESKRSTAIPELGVAFPHALLPNVPVMQLAVVHVVGGMNFVAGPGSGKAPRFGFKASRMARCDLFFAIVGDDVPMGGHVRLLARLARLVNPPEVRERLRRCPDAASLHAALVREDQTHVC
jgi:mannitol/fructose-specific phosphotransferase system IIA component (Ntr-type)